MRQECSAKVKSSVDTLVGNFWTVSEREVGKINGYIDEGKSSIDTVTENVDNVCKKVKVFNDFIDENVPPEVQALISASASKIF